MSDHTQGPWAVSKRKARRVTSMQGVVICNALLRNRGGPKCRELKDEHEAEANACLIAAAPEMLAVIKGFRTKLATYVSVYPGDKELRRLLSDCDAAIEKASS